MNYLAGLFLIYYKKEELAYQMLCQLLELKMMSTFTENFQNLQMNFYTVDRLNELFVPELWHHFKEERLFPVFYCSSWFITVFTNTLQYTERSYLVEWVLDFYFA
jgi:Rab-GTPase-TBC domain